jgi:hypothetical protein
MTKILSKNVLCTTSLNSAKLSSQTPLRFIPDRTLAQSGIRTGSAL